MKKKVLMSIVTLFLLFFTLIKVEALKIKTPLTANGTKPELYAINADGTTGDKISFPYSKYYILQSTAGNPIFCLDPYHQVYTAGNYSSGPYSGNVCGIIEGLTDNKITTNDLDLVKASATSGTTDQYITAYKKVQNLLWEYLNFTDCNSYVDVIVNRTNGSINISTTNSGKMEYDADKQYYKSGKITITPANISSYGITISGAPAGTYLVDGAGNKITNLNSLSGTKEVYLITPSEDGELSGNINSVKMTASGKYALYTFDKITPSVSKYTTSGYQAIGTITYTKTRYTIDRTASYSTTFSYNEAGQVSIMKRDAETGEPLADVIFGLYSDSYCSNIISRATTDFDGWAVFSGVTADSYVREISAPPYYNTDDSCVHAEMGTVMEFEDTIKRGQITVKKVDSKTTAALSGAIFNVYSDSSCNSSLQTAKTNAEGVAVFKDLPYGTQYYIKETYAPAGYTIDDASCKLATLGQTYSYKDTPIEEEETFTKISKLDITNQKEIPGAKIEISNDKNSKVINFTSTEKSYKVHLETLDEGYYYYLKETVAPKGYNKIETVFKFKINEFGEAELVSVGKFEKGKDGKDVFKDSSDKTSNAKFEGDTIIIYNEPVVEVDVPDTGKAARIIYTSLGSILVVSGGMLIYLIKNKKKQSEA